MSGPWHLVKMSGAGNDFIVLGPDEWRRVGADAADWIRRICRRRRSVGADGVLVVEPAGPDRVKVRFFNPDGSSAFCGNGSRCAARFARLRGFAGSEMILDTSVGEVPAEVREERVVLTLPAPRDLGCRVVDLPGEQVRGRAVDAGAPHLVLRVDEVSTVPLARWGPVVRGHPSFGPAGTNLTVMDPRPDGTLAIRTWERGVEGETLACGSGAVAAAFASRLEGGEEAIRILPASGVPLEVVLRGGPGQADSAILGGDARVIFEGEASADAIAD